MALEDGAVSGEQYSAPAVQRGKDDRRGVGLGLYMSRSIIEAHGGRIWAESKPDEGSRFTFSLPGSAPADG